jgi:hypothetical protein
MSGVHAFNFNLNINNNGLLRGVKSMPLKDLNSDADGSFSADRRAYENLQAVDSTQTSEQAFKKKWIGGCRDASDVSYRRRISAAGSSLNPSGGDFAFTSNSEKNTRIEALNRCRNQGKCATPKIRASPHHTNVPTPIFQAPNLVRTQNHAILTKGVSISNPRLYTNAGGFS